MEYFYRKPIIAFSEQKHYIICALFIIFRDTGEFETDVDIPQGTHEYKFLVDGAWQHDQSQVRP